MRTASPAVVRSGLPETAISASPSSRCATASNGAVCSLKPWPSSKTNSVTVPVARLTSDRLTTDPSWYFTRSIRRTTSAMGISLLLCDCCELIFGQPHLEHLVLSTCFYQYKLHCRNVISVLRWPDVLSLRGVPRLFEAPG